MILGNPHIDLNSIWDFTLPAKKNSSPPLLKTGGENWGDPFKGVFRPISGANLVLGSLNS